jgi:ubiquinone biosynthesis protein COQ9
MSDAIRERVLAEALPDIPEKGFSGAVLADAADRLGLSKRELQDSFPKGAASLVEAFSYWADTRMTEAVAKDMPERMRDRLREAVKARLSALVPHKQAARRAAAFLALPQNAGLAVALSARSVDLMWRAAGDRSSDFSYYTKRAMLGGVYAATFLYWLSDSSEGHAATWVFLDRRIEDAMRLEKLRATSLAAMAKFPNPLDIFANLRSGRR